MPLHATEPGGNRQQGLMFVTTEIKRTSVVIAGSLYWQQTEAVKLKINTAIAHMNRSECDEQHAYTHENSIRDKYEY